jgi:hypothetical protein
MQKFAAFLFAAVLACGPASAGPALPGPAQSQSALAGCMYTSGGPTLTSTNNQASIQCDAAGNLLTSSVMAPSATLGVTTQSCTVACASTIVSGAHSLYGISASATVTGTIFVYDATSCSANGTVTPKKAYAYTVANAPLGISWDGMPLINTTGIAVCFSSTGPYTATASTTAFLSVDYK